MLYKRLHKAVACTYHIERRRSTIKQLALLIRTKYFNGRRDNLSASSVWLVTFAIIAATLWGVYEVSYFVAFHLQTHISRLFGYYLLWATVLVFDFGGSKFQPITPAAVREMEYVAMLPMPPAASFIAGYAGPVITMLFLISVILFVPVIAVLRFLPPGPSLLLPLAVYSIDTLLVGLSINVLAIRRKWISHIVSVAFMLLTYASLVLFVPKSVGFIRSAQTRLLKITSVPLFPGHWFISFRLGAGKSEFWIALVLWTLIWLKIAFMLLNNAGLHRPIVHLGKRRWAILKAGGIKRSMTTALLTNIALSPNVQAIYLVLRSWTIAVIVFYLFRLSPVELWGILMLTTVFYIINTVMKEIRSSLQGVIGQAVPVNPTDIYWITCGVFFLIFFFLTAPVFVFALVDQKFLSLAVVFGLVIASAGIATAILRPHAIIFEGLQGE